MFRRANKITSLLIVAASVISLVPAKASIKLTNLNGYLDNVITFDGGYVYSGYKDSSSTGIYYYKYGDKDKLVEDSEYDLTGLYGNKYGILADSEDSGDDYLVDLSSGELDKDSEEDKTFDAAKNLKKKLKDTSKYGDEISIDSSNLTKIENGAKTGEVWYQYAVETTSSAVTVTTSSAVNLYGYTDYEGNYIDVSDIANIYAYSSEQNKMVKVREFSSNTNDFDPETKLQVSLTTAPTVIAQDKDYIYQLIKVNQYDNSNNAINPTGKTTVTIDFSKASTENTASYLPSNQVYSLPYAIVVPDTTIKAYTDKSTHTFNGTTFTYTTDSTLEDDTSTSPKTIYFRDRAELIQKIHDYNAMTIGTTVKTNNSANSKTNVYAFYDKLYVNTPVTFVKGSTTDITANPFYDKVDRKMYGNITGVVDSNWTTVEGAVLDVWGGNSTMRMLGSNTSAFGLSSDLITVAKVNTTSVNMIEALDKDKFTNTTNPFKVGTVEFNYNPLAESTDAFLYKDTTDLKTKVNAYFAAIKDDSSKMSAALGIDGAEYDDGTFTFESSNLEDGMNKLNYLNSNFTDIAVIDSDFENLETDVFPTTHTYIQKISKAQGEKKDGAYVPRSVESYEVTDKYNSENADAAKSLINMSNTYTVVNGKLQCIENTASSSSAGKLTVIPLKLKSDNVTFDQDSDLPSLNFDINQKVDAHIVEKDDESDGDDIDLTASTAQDIDVDGSVWAVNNGIIYKFNGERFKEVYSCSSLYDELSVYDKNNLVAWSEGTNASYTSYVDGVKQTIADATKLTGKVIDIDTLDTTTTTDAAVTIDSNIGTPGWSKTEDGIWNFYDSTGSKITNKWCCYDENWYYLNADGSMATGWLENSGKWYYLGDDGARKYGWVNVNDNWYFLSTLGDMSTGWINDEGKWYYLSESGAMLYNTTVNGYNLGPSGEIVSSSWIN